VSVGDRYQDRACEGGLGLVGDDEVSGLGRVGWRRRGDRAENRGRSVGFSESYVSRPYGPHTSLAIALSDSSGCPYRPGVLPAVNIVTFSGIWIYPHMVHRTHEKTCSVTL